jgi:hypothetical protein
MKTKIVSSILDIVESKDIDVTEDLKKDEKTCASVKEIFEEIKNEEKKPN